MDRLERLEMKYSEARAEYEQERSLNKDRMLNRIQKMEQEAKDRDPHDHGPNCICRMCDTVPTPDHWGQHPNCHTCRCLQANKYQGILYEDTKDNRCGKYCYLWNCRDSNWIVGETESVYRKLIDGKLRIVGFRCRGKRYDKAERVNK